MERFTKFFCWLLLSLLTSSAVFNTEVSAQSVLDPADPVLTYPANTRPQPPYGEIGKWVRTKRLNWNTDSYKAYIYKNKVFRLKFPKTYVHGVNDGKRYPMIIMFHGRGEAGPITDNEYQLYHGGQVHRDAVDNGKFDGFVFFMQNQGGSWGDEDYSVIAELIDYMAANNKLDRFRVNIHGLSFGGAGAWKMLIQYPTYVASSLPMSHSSIFYRDDVQTLKWVPMWQFQGGLDGNPAPATSVQVRDAILNVGGNFKYTLYPTLAHGTWNTAYAEPDFFPFILRAHKANPWPLFGRSEFCPGDPINITIGVSAGFDQYEWMKDNVLLPNTGNQINVTSVGKYECRVRKGAEWSPWSPTPLIVRIKPPTVSPDISVSGLASKVLPALDGKTSVPLEVPEGYETYTWQKVPVNTTIGTERILIAGSPGDYKVKVTEQFGCSSDFSTAFTVVNADGPNKPDAAINLIVGTLSKTSLRLDWSDNPAPAFDETNFEIYQATQPGGPYKLIHITGANVLTHTVTGLNSNVKYYYKIRAINNTAAAAPSAEASGTTLADTQAPSAPANLTIAGTSRNSITLDWNEATDDVGVTKYDIYINGVKSYTTSGTNFTAYNLEKGKSYNFAVKAKDFANNVSPFSNQVTGQPLMNGLNYKYYTYSAADTWNNLPDFTTLTPDAIGMMPTVALTPRTQNDNFAFLWEGHINIPAAGTYYFRTNSDDGSRLWLGALNGSASPYTFSGTPLVNNDGLHGSQNRNSNPIVLAAGTYPIAIAFYEQGGGESMTISWRTPSSGTTYNTIPASVFADAPVINGVAPAAPANLTATVASYKRIDLSWLDRSDNETGFEIYRSLNASTGFETVGLAPANATSYADTTLDALTTYYYKIRAIGQYGESALVTYTGATDANWRFNNNYTDTSGNNRTLSPSGSPAFDPDAADLKEGNRSVSLNGTSQHINFNTAANDYLRGAYSQKTVAFWMKSANNTGNRNIIDIGGNDDGLALRLDAGRLYAGIASNNTRRSFFVDYTSTNWNHIALVYNVNSLQLYVNGVLAGSNDALGFTATTTTSNASRIGYVDGSNAFNAGTGRFQGWIDNLAIYNQALTPEAINALMNTHTIGASSATTLALPPLPDSPANLEATASSSSVINISWNDLANEAKYELYRSSNNTSNYLLLATLPANTTSYADTGLFANAVFYYKLRAINEGGASGYSNEDSAATHNHPPVLTAIAKQYIRHSTQTQLNVSASDEDPGPLNLQVTSVLPGFASFVPNGNGSGVLTFNPGVADQGQYQVTLRVSDQNNGSHEITFDLEVNDNYVPELNAINNVTLKEKETSQVTINAVDLNEDDELMISFTGLPSFATPVINGRSAQVNLAPQYTDNGVYPVTAYVNDGSNGIDSVNFTITIDDVNPNKKIYINFSDGSLVSGAPWNNTNKVPALNDNFANLNDNTGVNSGIGLLITSPWQNIGNGTNILGVNTGNNTGVYPDAVIRSAYFTNANPQTIRIYGLNLQSKYKFTFMGSRGAVSDDRTSIYTISGQSVSLNAASNSQNTVSLQNLVPAADGTLTLTLQKGAASQFAYLNAMVIESTFDDGTAPAKPRALNAEVTANNVRLNWVDAAYNESSYQVYRSLNPAGPYELLTPAGNNAGLQQYVDGSIAANTVYHYYVTASNEHGTSPSSDTIMATTLNISPVIAGISNVTMQTFETLDVHVSATDSPGDIITLSALALPPFASFTDNGNGTGVLHLAPGAATGVFNNVSIVATDNQGASSAATFRITVQLNGLATIKVNFNAAVPVGAPWNSFNGAPTAGRTISNLATDEGVSTTVGVTLIDAWENSSTSGAVTGNNSGVFPDNVMSTGYYHSSSIPKKVRITGLSNAKKYNLIFFGSRGGVTDNRTTTFTASGKNVSLNAAGNTSNTVTISALVPNASGVLEFSVSKGVGSTFAYLNAMVIESYIDGGGSTQAITLQASSLSKSAIQLNWSIESTTHTGIEVYRASTQNGVYANLTPTPLAATATSFTDQSLPGNTQYFYKIRTVTNGDASPYSNIATAATLAYLVKVNFNQDMPAPAPWNNTSSLPQDGNYYPNFINDQSNPTGINMTVVGSVFNGVNNLGMNTGTNSGIYPDNVIRSTWWLDGGNTAVLKIDGLSQAMVYNFVFFASRDGGGQPADRTTLYQIGNKTVSLNAINNISQTAAINSVRADQDGAIYISISAGGASPYGYIGAMEINAFALPEPLLNDDGTVVTSIANVSDTRLGSTALVDDSDPAGRIELLAYPNPFKEDMSLKLTLAAPADKLSVIIVDMTGRVVFSKELRRLSEGVSIHRLGLNERGMLPGVYFMRVVGPGGEKIRPLTIMKSR